MPVINITITKKYLFQRFIFFELLKFHAQLILHEKRLLSRYLDIRRNLLKPEESSYELLA